MINIQKAAVIGCGFVGSSIAYALMQKGTFSEIVLLDANQKKAEGEAMDISHGLPFAHAMDIYKAVEGEKPLLHLDTHTNPDCGVGINIQLSLQEFYNEIQKTAEEKMNMITLQDIINTYYQRTSILNISPVSHHG